MKEKEQRLWLSSCDCFLGFLCGERVEKSTIEFEVKTISKRQSEYKIYGVLKGEKQTPKQIVDNRRGYLSRFIYCPYCGTKINWKQVISNCL